MIGFGVTFGVMALGTIAAFLYLEAALRDSARLTGSAMVVHIATLAAALIPFGNYLWTDLMPGANIVNVVLMLVLGYFVIILPLRIAGEGYSEEYYDNEV